LNNTKEIVIQNVTDYKPSRSEKKLLEALMNPANRLKAIVEICNIAKVSRQSYYRSFGKPEFVFYYSKQSAALVKRYIGQVMNAFIREAVRGSFQHGKVILEMAEVYAERSKVEHSGEMAHKHIYSYMSDAELKNEFSKI